MIRLQLLPDARFHCPGCHSALEVRGWYMPGMRTLADLRCGKCARAYYGDLPAGHGFHYPMLLDRESGVVTGEAQAPWFARWLRESWAHRADGPLPLTVEEFRPATLPLLLNCLDGFYGHSLLKLLNAQYYLDHRPDLDLIVLVPKFLRWMVPQGVAEVWTVDVPLREGWQWNDWLAREIRRRIGPAKEAWLSVAFSHPHPADYDIARFTGVRPFPIEQWHERMNAPTATFIWREDRLWDVEHPPSAGARLANSIRWRLRAQARPIVRQSRNAVALLESLRERLPALDAAVAGVGAPGGLPTWIKDLRARAITTETEKSWCARYAASHVVIGVHGSNMLLPSGHAGAVIDLMPPDRWGNMVQECLPRGRNTLDVLLRYRFVPYTTPPDVAAAIAADLLRTRPPAVDAGERVWCNDHLQAQEDPWIMIRLLRRRPADSHAPDGGPLT